MPTFERRDLEVAQILQEIAGPHQKIVPYDGSRTLRSFRLFSISEDRQIDRIDFDVRDYITFTDPNPASWKPHLSKRYGNRLRPEQTAIAP